MGFYFSQSVYSGDNSLTPDEMLARIETKEWSASVGRCELQRGGRFDPTNPLSSPWTAVEINKRGADVARKLLTFPFLFLTLFFLLPMPYGCRNQVMIYSRRFRGPGTQGNQIKEEIPGSMKIIERRTHFLINIFRKSQKIN